MVPIDYIGFYLFIELWSIRPDRSKEPSLPQARSGRSSTLQVMAPDRVRDDQCTSMHTL